MDFSNEMELAKPLAKFPSLTQAQLVRSAQMMRSRVDRSGTRSLDTSSRCESKAGCHPPAS
jgi:hypothetical protein